MASSSQSTSTRSKDLSSGSAWSTTTTSTQLAPTEAQSSGTPATSAVNEYDTWTSIPSKPVVDPSPLSELLPSVSGGVVAIPVSVDSGGVVAIPVSVEPGGVVAIPVSVDSPPVVESPPVELVLPEASLPPPGSSHAQATQAANKREREETQRQEFVMCLLRRRTRPVARTAHFFLGDRRPTTSGGNHSA